MDKILILAAHVLVLFTKMEHLMELETLVPEIRTHGDGDDYQPKVNVSRVSLKLLLN